MQLTDYLALIRERLVLVALIVAGTAIAATLLFSLPSAAYEASVRVRARPPAPFSASNEVFQEEQIDLGTEAELVRSVAVARDVVERLDLDVEPDDLLDQIATGVTPNTAVLVIIASAEDSASAVDIANAFAEEYLESRRTSLNASITAQMERVENQLAAAVSRLAELQRLADELGNDSTGAIATSIEREQVLAEIVTARESLALLADRQAIQSGFGEIIQPAIDARVVRATSLPRTIVFGLLIGVPLALATVLLLDSLNRSIRSQSDAERATGTEVLGLIPLDASWDDPRVSRLATRDAPLSAQAEAYRTVAHNLSRAAVAANAGALVFTSPGDGDGKSSLAANTAVALAEAGRLTTLVDADLRHPRLHAFLGAPREPGLSDVLSGQVALTAALQATESAIRFLPSGRHVARPDVLVTTAWTKRFLLDLESTDGDVPRRPLRANQAPANDAPSVAQALIVVDSPALLTATEASSVVAVANAVVLVLRAGLTDRQSASRSARQIRQAGGVLLGAVLIGGRMDDQGPGTELAPVTMRATAGLGSSRAAPGDA